jgi:hemerythrin superfamily protein
MNAIELIQLDHRTVEALFEAFDEAPDGTLVGQILGELTAHDDAEQAALYPLLMEVVSDVDGLDQALLDHAKVKMLMEHLRSTEGDALVAAVAALRAAVQTHVQLEETTLLPAIESAATPAQLEWLTSAWLRAKQRVG